MTAIPHAHFNLTGTPFAKHIADNELWLPPSKAELVDDLVAAAIWSNRTQHVRKAAKRVAHAARDVPEVFAELADFAADTAKLEAVARDIDLYDYWIAIAQAKEWAS